MSTEEIKARARARHIATYKPKGRGTHQAARRGSEWPEYAVWAAMLARCNNPKNPSYHNYGGRGISVCPNWFTFVGFMADMGRRPSDDHSIDRINNDGNYEPANCRWTLWKTQCSNKRQCHRIHYNGKTQGLAEWSAELGLPYEVARHRIIRAKWTPEKAFSTPYKSRK